MLQVNYSCLKWILIITKGNKLVIQIFQENIAACPRQVFITEGL